MRLGWCSREAARHACVHWHYSRQMPASKLMPLGVWWAGQFQGVVVFGSGASPYLHRQFQLGQQEVAELVRVALRTPHPFPTSRAVAVALRLLRRHAPKLRVVVSFADAAQGHHGGLYQAGNWLYMGATVHSYLRVKGRVQHLRSLGARYGTNSIAWLRQHVDPKTEVVPMPAKHRYVMPLTRVDRARLAPLGQPYPRRAVPT